ncbi:MAG: hypothetical protein ACHQKY_18000, partial [Terriglobia bacterium]
MISRSRWVVVLLFGLSCISLAQTKTRTVTPQAASAGQVRKVGTVPGERDSPHFSPGQVDEKMFGAMRWRQVGVFPGSRVLAVPRTQADTQSEPGAWVPWEVGFPTAGNAQNVAWEKQLLAIAAVIRESPALSDLRGFFPGLSGSNGTPVNWKGPIFGNLIFSAWWPKAIERTPDGRAKIKKNWEYNRPSGMNLRVNSFPTFGVTTAWMEDELGRFFPRPEARREIAGFSVYGDWLVITRTGKASVFSPVSQERVLRAYIKYLQPRAQQFEKEMERSKQEYADFTSPEGREKRRRHIEEIVAKLADPRIAETERRQAETRDRRREEDLRKAANPVTGDLALYATDELNTVKALLNGMSEADRRAPAWH